MTSSTTSKATSSTTTTTTTTASTTTTTATTTKAEPKIRGELTVTPMTVEDIKKTGIDISGEENYNAFKYTIEAEYDTSGVVIQRDVIYSSKGDALYSQIIFELEDGRIIELPDTNSGSGYNSGSSSNNSSSTVSNAGTFIEELGATVYHEETVDEEMYMFIDGNCKWLKEFYDVQLYVINKGTGTINNCKAELNIPDGLTLVKGDRIQSIEDMKSNDARTAHWYD